MLDETAATLLDQQTGELPPATRRTKRPDHVALPGSSPRGDLPLVRGEVYAGSGGASRFFYVAKPSKAERNAGHDANHHPTVKPVALMRWLVRMVTHPGGVVLDPFMGSGTTLEAATLEGFHGIGVELTAEYLPLAQGRTARPLQVGLFS